ncbi:hypothetical protein ABW20_dc0100391 [Dactylellina cionopaga]|nr:hypothetical protein ABW20_dc0100391 [Dactylellina cionopaga]
MEDEEYYLQPGFDANTLKIPQIRSILLKHDIDYPSNVKKAKLVEIFDTVLAPQAPAILSRLGKVKASTKGIVNAEDYGTIGEPEVGPTPKRRASRRKMSIATDEDGTTGDEEAAQSVRRASRRAATPKKRTASPVKRGRKSSVRPETTDDDEPAIVVVEETPKPKRGRRSLAATKTPEPQPVHEPSPSPSPTPTPETVADNEPVFSNENIFQMGSSPRYPPADKDRRKSMPIKDTPRKIDSSRRRTEGVPSVRKSPEAVEFDRGSPTPTPTKFIPMSRFKSLTPEKKILEMQEELDTNNAEMERRMFGNEVYIKEEEDSNISLEPGEEFVPEEQWEVELEDENANAVTHLARKKAGSSEISTTLLSILYTLVGIAFIAYGFWWREEKLKVGYCGIGKPVMKNPNFADWINNLTPNCEPCPSHAICRDRLATECYTDYVLVPHPFSLKGIVPLAPTCQPDSEKIRRVSVLSDAVTKRLRDRAAAIECGYIRIGREEEEGLMEKDIKEALYAMKSPTLSDLQFTELWDNAVQDLEKKDEIVTNMTTGGDRYFKSTNLSHVSFSCSVRKNMLSLLFRWKLEIFGVVSLLLAGLKIRSSMIKRQIYSRQVQRLVGIALKRLAQQQRAYYNDKTADIAYIPVNQLRDQILSREFDPVKRQEVWAGVSKVVELNSNVRTTSVEHMGEIMRCWTWIGSSALLDIDGGDADGDEEGSQKDEQELRSIMGEEVGRKELVKKRDELTPRILF